MQERLLDWTSLIGGQLLPSLRFTSKRPLLGVRAECGTLCRDDSLVATSPALIVQQLNLVDRLPPLTIPLRLGVLGRQYIGKRGRSGDGISRHA